MKKYILSAFFILCTGITADAQNFNQLTDDGMFTGQNTGNDNTSRRDSTKKDKEIPKGLRVWTVDERFGDITNAVPDSASHMFMNTIFTEGIRGEYNTTGNLGAPRINRIFTDRKEAGQFIFTEPYDFIVKPVSSFLFTNTLSPITNLTYDGCGDKTNGEDHVKAIFGVNAGKKLGMGFMFDYIYGRGYYQNQSTSHFNYTMYASYLGERYNAHLLMSTNHQKVTENGGITDDEYITHPEMFEDDFKENEIPTVLEQNWNRNDNQHIFFSHRYNVGFYRKVKMTEQEIEARKFAMESKKENDAIKAKEEARKKAQKYGRKFDDDKYDEQPTFAGRPDDAKIMGDEPIAQNQTDSTRITVNLTDSIADTAQETDTAWMKREYVPVTSFIHTLKFDNYKRIYQSYYTPADYYTNKYYDDGRLGGDSIYDRTKFYSIKNTLAIALLEGFNKWAKAGLKAFVTSDLRSITLPDSIRNGVCKYNEHNLSIGAQLSKTSGNTLHYNITAETWLTGEDAGQMKIDGRGDINLRLFKDTVTLNVNAFLHRINPSFYYRHYHSKHFWWDNDGLSKEIRSHIGADLYIRKTGTMLRAAMDNIKNHTYFAQQYTVTEDKARINNNVMVRQCDENINILTLQLNQNFRFGILNWENQLTYQKSSKEEVIGVPTFNIYSNLYLRFKIAKVLKVDFGADIRYFTKYYAPDYSPALGQYTTQDNGANNIEIGNYPIINVYANMHLKQTRFFVMMSHVNYSDGNAFMVPHYPTNQSIIRFGLSWNFFN
ncbi:MAG: putative porin [Prevotella sp.]|nr:putative porin [Prevotella sp.]